MSGLVSRVSAFAERLVWHCVSVIPVNYLRGYRRLAESQEEIDSKNTSPTGRNCWTCKHAIAFVTWHCARMDGCSYKRCFVRGELPMVDRISGRWLSLPENPPGDDPKTPLLV